MKKVIIFLAFAPSLAIGQGFRFEADLDSVIQSGFHRVELDAEIGGRCHLWQDLRILDEANRQVPYLRETSTRMVEDEVFQEYQIIRQDYTHRRTTIVIHNPEQQQLDNINLLITNADANKLATVSGSYDQQQWFVVRDHFRLQGGRSWNDVQEVRLLALPLIDYTYIKLVIHDCFVDPLQIVKAGTYNYLKIEGRYDPIPSPNIVQIPDTLNANTTLYRLEFDRNYPIDRIQFIVEGAPYFQRYAEVFFTVERTASKRQWKKGNPKHWTEEDHLLNFNLSSASLNIVDRALTNTNVYYLRIYNEDNPPLVLKSVRPQMLKTSVVAHFEKDKRYLLAFGDENLHAPSYDISYFTSKIPHSISSVGIGPVVEGGQLERPRLADINTKTILWVVLAAVGLVVLLFTAKMLRDLKNGDEATYDQEE